MTRRPTLLTLAPLAALVLSLLGCAGEAAPLPEVRYFAIADT